MSAQGRGLRRGRLSAARSGWCACSAPCRGHKPCCGGPREDPMTPVGIQVRSWSRLSTFIRESPKTVPKPAKIDFSNTPLAEILDSKTGEGWRGSGLGEPPCSRSSPCCCRCVATISTRSLPPTRVRLMPPTQPKAIQPEASSAQPPAPAQRRSAAPPPPPLPLTIKRVHHCDRLEPGCSRVLACTQECSKRPGGPWWARASSAAANLAVELRT